MPERLRYGPFLLLEPAARERLRSRTSTLKLRQGATLIDERRGGHDAYLLLDGSLRVVARDDDRTLAIVGAPALVGEMAALAENARSATVVADTPCTVLRVPGADLRRLMDGQPLFATAMRERTDLLLADAFLKRRSPLRDLPGEIVAALASRLRPRELATDQLIEGGDDDLYLVRRGAVERMSDGQVTGGGDFVQRARGERYAAVGETSLYELRMSDVAREILGHQERVRAIASRLDERARVRVSPRAISLRAAELGGSLVHDEAHRAVVSEHVAALLPRLDGHTDVAALVRESGRARGAIVEGLAMLVAAGLAELND